MKTMDAQLNRGMAVDVKVGESITLFPLNGPAIVLTIEPKSGQRSRIRIQSDDGLKIELPKKHRLG